MQNIALDLSDDNKIFIFMIIGITLTSRVL